MTEPIRPYVAKEVTDEELTAFADEAMKPYLLKLAKEKKSKMLGELVITSNSVAYDAHGDAIGNMSAVVALANAKFNKALAYGEESRTTYEMIFKNTKIGWKNAENKISYVQIESIVEALEKSMYAVSEILVEG